MGTSLICMGPPHKRRVPILHTCVLLRSVHNEPYLKFLHTHKTGCCSVWTVIKFVWVTMGRKFLNGHTLTKIEDIKL